MSSSLEICSSALIKLGNEPITSFIGSKRARLCAAQYPIIKRKMIRLHQWNFAIRRATLTPIQFDFLDAAVTTGTEIINIPTHGMVTSDRFILKNDGGALPEPLAASQNYYAIVIDGDNFKVSDSIQNSIDGVAIDITSAAGTGTHTMFPFAAFDYDYQFNLPSDYLRVTELKDSEYIEWQKEGDRLVANQEYIQIKYLADVDESLFDDSVNETIAYALAEDLAFALDQSGDLGKRLRENYKEDAKMSRLVDAQEGTPQDLEANEWLDSRL